MNQVVITSRQFAAKPMFTENTATPPSEARSQYVVENTRQWPSVMKRFFQWLPAIPADRKPWLGCVVGATCGSLGIGLYFFSLVDFALTVLPMLLVILIAPDTPDYALWVCWGVWGYLRVKHSRVRSPKQAVITSDKAAVSPA